jgi:hypothetical protein
MPKFHTLVMQVSKNTYLFLAGWEIKYATYIVNGVYKTLWRGGLLPQSASFHFKATESSVSATLCYNKSTQHMASQRSALASVEEGMTHRV